MKVSERRERATYNGLAALEWLHLAADNSAQVRGVIAGREDAPSEALVVLSADPVASVREAVVENPSCPAEALDRLVGDPNTYIRREAVQHPNATSQIYAKIASTGDPTARWALAQLPQVDAEVSARLVEDDDWPVRAELAWATRHADILTRLLQDRHPCVRGQVASNPQTTDAQRRILAHDPCAETRAILAGSRDNPDDVLFKLARDKSTSVRFGLTVHGTNRPLMELLMEDTEEIVAETARNSLRRPPRSDVVFD